MATRKTKKAKTKTKKSVEVGDLPAKQDPKGSGIAWGGPTMISGGDTGTQSRSTPITGSQTDTASCRDANLFS